MSIDRKKLTVVINYEHIIQNIKTRYYKIVKNKKIFHDIAKTNLKLLTTFLIFK